MNSVAALAVRFLPFFNSAPVSCMLRPASSVLSPATALTARRGLTTWRSSWSFRSCASLALTNFSTCSAKASSRLQVPEQSMHCH
eukprot:CAMPEP_0181496352 /NCGR_PEP_ID=MMETSP1110-20121109/52925_1 /TAXON_ID=174948 /ORGANISM="Symbiodinium sp., Strain CCMP421" /LENGTH=84 /DNA_ID=CAMNT_0023624157 /DNA_START=97 /DNA_END=348 /DNA_ORIENTATION=-